MDLSLPANFFSDFHFLRPWWLLALLPALLFGVILWRIDNVVSAWAKAIDSGLLPYLLDRSKNTVRRQPVILLLSAWLLSTLALAGPVWQKLPQPVQQREDALVIVFDLSLSMFVQDHRPNRLDLAKRKLRDVLGLRQEGQTGLVVYAGDAHIVTPLTDDVVTISALVPALDPNIMPLFGSNPVAAIDTAVGMLDDAETLRGRILLMTDGIRDFGEEQTLTERMNATPYQLLVMGIGTEGGGPIRVNEGGYLKDGQGQVVIPKLNRPILQSLANRVGGRYHDIQLSDSDLEYLLTDFDFFSDERLTEAGEEFDAWAEVGPWLLLLVLPLCALGFRRGWLFSVLVMAGLTGFVAQPTPALAQSSQPPSQPPQQPPPQLPSTAGGLVLTPDQLSQMPSPATEASQAAPGWRWRDLWQTRDQQGAAAVAAGDHAAAAGLFESPQWRGAAAYRSADFEAAVASFSAADTAAANYNRGNALTHSGNYAEAVSAFERTLEMEPEHEDALHNKRIAEQLLERQEQENSENQDGDNEDSQSQQDSEEESQRQEEEGEQEQQSQEGEQDEEQQQQENEASEEQESSESDNEQNAENEMSNEEFEQQQAVEQWLRRIQDDPGELLTRKFRYQYRQRQLDGSAVYRQGDQVW